MSDTPDTEHAQAEPVDAEFEPAPGSDKKARKTKAPGRGLPWLTIAVVTVAASSLGGGTGWLIGRYAPNPNTTALETRLSALEAAGEAAGTSETLTALQARLATVEGHTQVAQLRAEAFEQLIRDVAALRGRVDTMEAGPASGEEIPAQVEDSAALAALQSRVDAALAALSDRLDLVSADTDTARTLAEQAQISIQQALNTLSQSEAQAGTNPANPALADAVTRAELAAVETRITGLEQTLATLNAQADRLESLQASVDALANPNETASAQSLDALTDRIAVLESGLEALSAAEDAAQDAGRATASLADRALAFAALSRAAAGSDPFPVAVADLQRLWPNAPGASALTAPARTGAPTLDQLVASFPANAVRAATGESRMWLGVIRVEREGTSGPTPAIEAALNGGNLAGAVAATQSLEGEAAGAAAVWLAQAEARLAIEEALAALADALSRAEETAG